MSAFFFVCLAAVLSLIVGIGLFETCDDNPAVHAGGESTATSGQNATAPNNNSAVMTASQQINSDSTSPNANLEEGTYEPGVVLVSIDNEDAASAISEQLSKLDYVADASLNKANTYAGFIKVTLTQGTDVSTAIGNLAQEGFSSEPNLRLEIAENDSSLASQATTVNDPSASLTWPLEAVDAYKAWDIEKTNGSVTVAVIDTGCAVSHEDLEDTIYTTTVNGQTKIVAYDASNANLDYKNIAAITPDSFTDPSTNGHGTHVAGIVAATANNGKGTAGVSYNAKVIPIKIMNEKREIYSDALDRGLAFVNYYYSTFGIKVINMSIGSSQRHEASEGYTSTNSTIKSMDTAYSNNMLVVCAAGNYANSSPTGAYWNFPSDYSESCVGVIALGTGTASTTASRAARAAYSNYNKTDQTTKDISAPGTHYYSTINSGTNQYGYLDGTSMASPCVAGIAAMVYAANASLKPADVSDILYVTASDLDASNNTTSETTWSLGYGWGEINAYRALQIASATIAPESSTISSATTTDIAMSYKDGTNWSNYGSASDWEWTSSNPEVATVSSNTVTGVSAGTATIKATLKDASSTTETPVLTGYSVTTNITVNNNLSSATIEPIDNQAYTGQQITPSVKVSLNGKELTQDTDYKVSYADNTEKGTAKVTITGIGTCTGSKTASFKILKALSSDMIAHIDNQTYTGKSITPTLVVTDGNSTLASGIDYTISYANNNNAGTASVTVNATSNSSSTYAGSAQATFTIVPADISTATIGPVQSYMYSGDECKPTPSVTLNDFGTLKNSIDFSYAYNNNINAGTGYVHVVGKGNFTGSTSSASFAISKTSLSNATISIADQTYTGNAHTPAATVKVNERTLTAGSDYTISYSNNVYVGRATVQVTGIGNYTGTSDGGFDIVCNTVSVSCRTHVQNDGWQSWQSASQGSVLTSGTTGRALRLEGAELHMYADGNDASSGIRYRTHVQNIGWQDWATNGNMAGTEGRALRLEAIQIELSDVWADHYDIYYRVHAENIGWMDWAKNGQEAGTAGYAYRLEALQVCVVPKGSAAPAASPSPLTNSHFQSLAYHTHVQNIGWQGNVTEGQTSGTTGQALRLEAIAISLGASEYSGNISYRTHVENIGWQDWATNGNMAGTEGRALRLEAIQIELSGEMANQYDVWYRTHVENFGWSGWAENGAQCGSAGYGYRLEAIQIRLVPKGSAAPGSTEGTFHEQ